MAYSSLGFWCLCLELCSVNTYIKVEFNVWYFQWYVSRRVLPCGIELRSHRIESTSPSTLPQQQLLKSVLKYGFWAQGNKKINGSDELNRPLNLRTRVRSQLHFWASDPRSKKVICFNRQWRDLNEEVEKNKIAKNCFNYFGIREFWFLSKKFFLSNQFNFKFNLIRFCGKKTFLWFSWSRLRFLKNLLKHLNYLKIFARQVLIW